MRDLHLPGRSEVLATNGMCATSHPLAAGLALDILKSGGNAVDAAIAAALVLGLCEPQSTGIGGDMFALIRPPGTDRIIGLNASGRGASGLDAAQLRADGHAEMPLLHPASVTIPGAIDGFVRLSQDHGRLGLDAVLAPVIAYAEAGIPIAERVAFDYSQSFGTLSGAGITHYGRDGAGLRKGDIFRAPGQAEVLRRVAKDGRAGFYEGDVAEDMVASLRALGGVHTLEDFAATRCDYVEPIVGSYKGYDLIELPPNGQGATAILLANILSQFDLASMDPHGAERTHIEAEATKLAYDARNRFVADPPHRLEHMMSMDTAVALAGLIDPDRAMASATTVSEAVHKDTVYLTVVDKDRMAVSMIYSIFHSFGSGLASDKFGILFQNRGGGFTLEEGHPNEAAGGKRPMHTIIPGMIRKGDMLMPFGVMGGQYQSTGHARFLSNIADYQMSQQDALDGPRAFAQEGRLDIERGYSSNASDALVAKGHDVAIPDTPIGGAQNICIDGDLLIGASDPRKDGAAIGY